MKRAHPQPTTRRGFTLMEMLVVLAILVLLVAMVAPRILGTREKANLSAAKSQVGLFKTALDKYAFDTGSYPMSEQGLRSLVEPPAAVDAMGMGMADPMAAAPMPLDPMSATGMPMATTTTAGTTSGWDGPYLDSLPKDPWGNDYMYQYPPTRNRSFPDIWSLGPDRTDATEDDICNWDKAAVAGQIGTGEAMPMDMGMPMDAGMPPAPVMPAAPAPPPGP